MMGRNAVRIRTDMTLGDIARQIRPDIDLAGHEADASVLVSSVFRYPEWADIYGPDITVMVYSPDDGRYQQHGTPPSDERLCIHMSYCVAIGRNAMADLTRGAWNFCLGDDTQLPSPVCDGFVNLGNRLCFWRETGEVVPCWIAQTRGCS